LFLCVGVSFLVCVVLLVDGVGACLLMSWQ